MIAKVQPLWRRLERIDERIIRFMQANGLRLLRIALGIVFVWFGLLKVIGQTPVYELVGNTVYWVDPAWFVPFLGLWEIVVGLGLLFGIALRLTLLFFFMQMIGTFLVLIVKPEVAFQDGNLLLLTVEGEFVVKNLVLLAAGIAVGGTVERRKSGENPRMVSITAQDNPV